MHYQLFSLSLACKINSFSGSDHICNLQMLSLFHFRGYKILLIIFASGVLYRISTWELGPGCQILFLLYLWDEEGKINTRERVFHYKTQIAVCFCTEINNLLSAMVYTLMKVYSSLGTFKFYFSWVIQHIIKIVKLPLFMFLYWRKIVFL